LFIPSNRVHSMPSVTLPRALRFAVGLLFVAPALAAQTRLTTSQEALGFNVGDDYRLATYTQLTNWWKQLDAQSDRMTLVSIGKTAEGRDQWMAIITAPGNHAKLARLKEISAKLARAEGLTDEQARALAKEGKAVVWIDGGLHATEVLGSHQLMEHVWQMVSRTDEETLRLLDDVVQLVVHANPDGMELVSGWYMRIADESKRTTGGIPRLYQKYVGHDNNRDFYLNAQAESENMSRAMYREWYPQIMYNHHQTGPAGTVMFAPPFRDPHNHNLDPLLVNGITMVGAAMHSRFAAEGKPGTTMREGASYQTWWNGGLRTAAYFHNMVGILTETIGNPTPMEIPFVPARQLSTGDLPFPITPQRWHFRQSIDYSITANRAILDLASRYRETWLYNIYLMGKNSIRRGNQDSWTTTPKEIDAVTAAARQASQGQRQEGPPAQFGGGGTDRKLFDQILRDPSRRDPRGYVIPATQPDFPTATKFVNALIKSGVDVHWATSAFTAGGKQYPAGSWVIKTAQSFRPHVLDMFEPQDYPNDLQYPGGPPKAPYDNAGYTLAMSMGVQYDRILDAFDGPFEKVPDLVAKTPGGAVAGGGGWMLSGRYNDAVTAVNRLLAAKVPVSRLVRDAGGHGAGAFYIAGGGKAKAVVDQLAAEKGLRFEAAASPGASAVPLKPVRVGLWDQYGGSMPSGWIRWLLEQMEVPFTVVYPGRLDAGNLRQDFDVLIFPDGGIPAVAGGVATGAFGRQPSPDEIPAEYRDRLGRVTAEKTVPQLKAFLEAGGRIVAIGGSTALAGHLDLPVTNHLVERTPNGQVRSLPRDKFYVPASLLEVTVDTTAGAAWGLPSKSLVLFDESPVFDLDPGAIVSGTVKPIAWFASAAPLRSGWAWGQAYLEGGIAAAEAKVGRGTLYLYGPEITFRAQPHGTFKLLFNAILNSGM
jgi:hypothetical protein